MRMSATDEARPRGRVLWYSACMELLHDTLLPAFIDAVGDTLDNALAQLSGKSPADITYTTEAGAVFSSNIEGNPMDLNSFMNTKAHADAQKPREYEEIIDLADAYHFAQTHALTEEHLLTTHGILAELIVSPGNRGTYRQDRVGVFSSAGLAYMAIEHEYVAREMKRLFSDIATLEHATLSSAETVYYASYIHLVFAHIHPFMDGNGRVARLLEKWFLAHTLGQSAWAIESERYYKEHRAEYYATINLGPNYYESEYAKALPFLRMLPMAVRESCTK